ncbi:hypothetical protein WME97_44955 [Sorangium sp. So ce367]|uniref:hypothetical protein n=1 Tax=Sorangium sp. So ce367 TaxID=3133305 RepID=UPI003F62E197
MTQRTGTWWHARSRVAALAAAGALAAATALAAAPAAAQPVSAQDQAAAQALFDEGRALAAAGKHAEACPKLEESYRLDPAIGTQYYLAECLEGLGRTASAWTLYLQVGDLAAAAGQSARASYARQRAEGIAPSLVRLAIRVPDALRSAPGLRVERDGSLVGPPQWGAAVPVDPGRHAIVVTAPGKKPWRHEVDASAPGTTVAVDVPPLEDAPGAPAAGAAAPAPAPRPAPSPRADAAPWSTQRVLGLVAGGAGLAAAAVGAGFGVHAMAKRDASNDGHCDAQDYCDPEGLGLREQSLDAARVSTIAFVGAGLALAGGAVLFFTAPSRTEPAAAQVGVSIGPLGASVVGRF